MSTTKNRKLLGRLSASSNTATTATTATPNSSISSGFMSLSSSFANISTSFANALALELDVDLCHNEEDNKRSSNANNNSSSGINNGSANNNISAMNISQDDKKCPPPKFRPSQFNKIDWTDDKERLKKLSNKHQQHQQQQQQQHEWTDERANLVQTDAHLKALLAAEVQKSGVVTTVGYNAVLQKFLMSDEVEKKMANEKASSPKNIHQAPRRTRRKASARRQQQQHGLIGRLVSSFSSVPTSMNGDNMTSENLNRRGSVDCDVARNCRELLLQSSPNNIDNDDVGGLPSSFDDDGRSRDNIAPRKMKSFRREKQQEIITQVSTTDELQRIDMRALQALQESELLDKDDEDDDHDHSNKSPIIVPSDKHSNKSPIVVQSKNNIRRRRESLNLEDVFDGKDGTKSLVHPPPHPSLKGNVVLPVASSPPKIVDALGSNNNISYNDDNVILEHANHGDDTTASIGNNKDGEGEDLESLSSKGSEDGGYLAWPHEEGGY